MHSAQRLDPGVAGFDIYDVIETDDIAIGEGESTLDFIDFFEISGDCLVDTAGFLLVGRKICHCDIRLFVCTGEDHRKLE